MQSEVVTTLEEKKSRLVPAGFTKAVSIISTNKEN